VPNLFSQEERFKIVEEVGGSASGSVNEKFRHFVRTCRKFLHIVLTFSPVGEFFRKRLRLFPTLVNCTTIDWFLPWPVDALRTTAHSYILRSKEQLGLNDGQLGGLVEVAVDMQSRVTRLSDRYLQELRQHNYVTPKSFLELLLTFESLAGSQQAGIDFQIKRYEVGVAKILKTEHVIELMQKELQELQPMLVVKTEEISKLLIKLQKK